MPKAPAAPDSVIQLLAYNQLRLFHPGKDHLGDPVPSFHNILNTPQVYDDEHDLAAIISTHGTRGVEKGEAVL